MIQIKRNEDGTHSVDGVIFRAEGAKRYKKRFEPLAVQMQESFSVETLEGTMEGKAGDWLMAGAHGEMYPCGKEIFEQTYEEVE